MSNELVWLFIDLDLWPLFILIGHGQLFILGGPMSLRYMFHTKAVSVLNKIRILSVDNNYFKGT